MVLDSEQKALAHLAFVIFSCLSSFIGISDHGKKKVFHTTSFSLKVKSSKQARSESNF